MVLNQFVSFVYSSQSRGLSAERENLSGPLVLDALSSWKISDRLNKLKQMVVTVSKADIDRSKVFFERDVFVPGFNFRGLITGINDIDDSFLSIVMSEQGWHFTRRLYKIQDGFKEYTLELEMEDSLVGFLQEVLDSANEDMPFDWVLGDDVPESSSFSFDVKWKTYYDVLRTVAINTSNDLWFEEGRVVKFGTKGKSIVLDRDDKIYEKLSTKIDLDTYGNIINVVGAKGDDDTNVHSQTVAPVTDLLYNYERVVSNNNLKDQAAVDGVLGNVLADFDSVIPDVKINISEDIIHKYQIESGDVIKISSNSETQTVKGFYRAVEVSVSSETSFVKLQFSKTGKFIPRVSDSLDILDAIMIKLHDIELNS